MWGIIFIVIGIPLCLFGLKMLSVTLFCVGTLVTVTLILLLFYSTFLKDDTEAWIGWVVLAGSIIVGLAGGYLLYKCQKLGAMCIAGWGGFLGGLLLNTTFMFAAGNEIVFWCINIGCAGVAAGLAYCFFYPVIITATSMSGAYMFVRGISFYAGGFPNEFDLIKSLENGSIPHMSYWFYLYLAFIAIFTVVGMVFQCKQHKKSEEEDTDYATKHPFRDY